MSEVVRWSSGGTPKTTTKEFYENGTIPWLVIGDLNDGVVTGSAAKITPLGLQNSSAKMIPPGTLLIAMYGSIGKLGITGMDCCTNQAIAYAKELHGVTAKYMYYYLLMLRSELIRMGKGGTQKNISQTILNSIEILVPPLPEQERITARLEEQFAQLAPIASRLNTAKGKLKTYRQAVFASVIGAHPDAEAPLSAVAELIDGDRGKNYPKWKDFSSSGDCLFLNAQNVRPYGWSFASNCFISRERDQLLRSGKLRKNDVVITTRGTVGNVAVYDDAVPYEHVRINSCMLILRPDLKAISPYYLAAYLMSPMFQTQIKGLTSGTAQPQLPASILKKAVLSVPPLAVQREILRALEDQLSVCDSIEQTIQTALQRVDALRQSILKQAFEGKY